MARGPCYIRCSGKGRHTSISRRPRRRTRHGGFTLVVALAALACEAAPSEPSSPAGEDGCANDTILSFTPVLGDADEAYVCYGFDAGQAAAESIQSVRWSIGAGAVAVHHAILYALTDRK